MNRLGGGVMHRHGAFRELAWVMARSRLYTTWEKLRYFQAEAFSLAHLYDDLAAVDLFAEIPRLDVPIYFVHGRHDYQVPMAIARDYHDGLDAPHKEFVVFDDAAHSPLFEDPDRFHTLMREVVDRTTHPPVASSNAPGAARPDRPGNGRSTMTPTTDQPAPLPLAARLADARHGPVTTVACLRGV